jgi:fatty acid amide hydrolase
LLQAASITDLSATELVRLIAADELSAREVVAAHIDRIQEVNPRLNAVVSPRFEQALDEARLADQRQAQGQQLGLLHGLPITIKDFFDLTGAPTTAGLTARATHRATSDAQVVGQLRAAGAIVLGKTNVAQLGMMMECDNPLFGRTNNPWNLKRSPGGSTGGEAAIIAARGSPLGLGSDGGGSIRQPCHCTGIAGLKPTAGRLSLAGHWHSPSFPDEWVQPGPMARTVADLELAWRVLSSTGDAQPAEAAAARQPLRVGVYADDQEFRPSPAIRRAVAEAAELLSRRGVEVVETNYLGPGWKAYMSLLYADRCDGLREQLAGSASDWRIRQIVQFGRTPGTVRKLAGELLAFTGQRHLARLFRAAPLKRLGQAGIDEHRHQLESCQTRVLSGMREQGIDALLCPPHALVAPRHGNVYVNLASLYTATFNMLGFPAGVVPVTCVRAGEESDRPHSLDLAERAAARSEADSAGLPVGVQVAAPPGREDLVLSIMRTIEEQRGSEFDSRPPR